MTRGGTVNAVKAALYCRLSVEDEDKDGFKNTSESILNQQMLLVDYMKAHHYDLYAIYVDEDYSGLDRERPAFKRMIEDAKSGRFQVILCKTQSRFTRDMELVERYLHHLFPLWGIRFIGVVDGVDTDERRNKKARQINGLINEWYCEDLSDNIRAVLRKKMENGQFIGSFACYGYSKSPLDRHRLVVDDDAAAIVKRIFSMYQKGYGIRAIAAHLTQCRIPTPTMHKRSQGLSFRAPFTDKPQEKQNIWSPNTIKRILKNPTYTGCLVQGREQKISYKSKKMVHMPKERWIIIPDTHEAIISKEEFAAVQEIMKGRRKNGNTLETSS